MSREYPCIYYDNQMCKKFSDDNVQSWCVLGPCGEQRLSNADRIRAMSDEELAEVLMNGRYGFGCDVCSECKAVKCSCECAKNLTDWLKQPVKDGEGDGRT